MFHFVSIRLIHEFFHLLTNKLKWSTKALSPRTARNLNWGPWEILLKLIFMVLTWFCWLWKISSWVTVADLIVLRSSSRLFNSIILMPIFGSFFVNWNQLVSWGPIGDPIKNEPILSWFFRGSLFLLDFSQNILS